MCNAYWEPLTFELPRLGPGGGAWRRWIDTYRDAPDDIADGPGPPVDDSHYTVQPRSLVALLAPRAGGTRTSA